MKYTCNLCNKEFNQKSHYSVHINRKFSCINNSVIINDDINNHPQNSSKILKNSSKILKNSGISTTIINDVIKTYKCEYCNKSYTRSDNFKRHQLQFCKEKEIKLSEVENKIETLNEELKHMAKENNELKKLINTNPKCKKIITNNTTNTTNNNANNIIQNQQNNNINIKMVNFGDEDINKLTEEEILSILTSKSKAFVNLIKAIHLNERLPLNANI